jgi:hypothetical protein
MIHESAKADPHRQEILAMQRTMADVLKEEGRKEEAVRARQRMLLLVLRERFGELPSAVVSTIEAARNVKQLDEWAARFATAKTLAEVEITTRK